MHFPAFLRSFFSYLRPFRSDTFYDDFLQTRKCIHAKEATIVNQFKLHFTFFLYISLHMLYLSYNNLSPYQRLVHFDIVFFLVTREFNLMGALLLWSAIYFAYQMYFTCPETNNSLLLSILDKGDTQFFLYPKTETGRPIVALIQAKLKMAFNLMQTVLAVFGKVTLSLTLSPKHREK